MRTDGVVLQGSPYHEEEIVFASAASFLSCISRKTC